MNLVQDMFSIILLTILTSLLFQPVGQVAAQTSGQDIVIYYSNDVHGETEPCG